MPSSFAKNLKAWYRAHARRLPWRETDDPYKIWISEIMLQQTTVSAVIPYYQRWINVLPSVRHVARASSERILKLWQGLGYYSRARNIHRTAKIICEDFDGRIPNQAHHLEKLPGFGPYTVGAVLSIAFDQRQPIIDANVRRVVMRILAAQGHADISQDRAVLAFLEMVMPRKNLRTFNQALMELGALVCRSREPLCLSCPVRAHCRAYHKGVQEIIPEPKKKIIQDVDVAVGLIRKGGKYFIQKRPAQGLLAGLWEFPGGKIDQGESPLQALRRELKEELGVDITSARPVMHVRHYYTQFRVKLHVFACDMAVYPRVNSQRLWAGPKRLACYPMPSGSAKIVERLMKV